MFIGRYFWELSGRKLQRTIKKSQTPERTRISYLTALTGSTYVVLPKENHMQHLYGTAESRALRLPAFRKL